MCIGTSIPEQDVMPPSDPAMPEKGRARELPAVIYISFLFNQI